jgi:hypothetical protein
LKIILILTFANNAICANFRGDDLDESLSALHEKGYVLISGIFNVETTQNLVSAIDSILEVENGKDIMYDEGGHPIKIRYPLSKHPIFLSSLQNDALIELVDSLFPSGDAILTWEDVLVKQPNSNTEVLVHQDLALQTTRGNVYSIGLSLHEDSHNPVFFLPESHNAGPLTRIEVQILDKVAKSSFVPVETNVGDALIHDVRCVHYSEPMKTDLPRYTWYLEFRSESDLKTNGPWDESWIDSRKQIWSHVRNKTDKAFTGELKVPHVTAYLAYDQTSPYNHFVDWNDEWKATRPHRDGTHHCTIEGEQIYDERFETVLPFHEPGLAPASDGSRWFFILPDGKRAFYESFQRTFGFYGGLATVVDDGNWYHIRTDGTRAYQGSWNWCGNFQQRLCAVRNEIGEYYHINSDGATIPSGPHSYAGDFREGVAVVRCMDGFCRHIDFEGEYIHEGQFLDLDVFHKGLGRARDLEGWHHIDMSGNDASAGKRYAELEPFYNGQALARTITGQYIVINEDGNIVASPVRPDSDVDQHLQEDAISYWRPLAIRLGILSGLADGEPTYSLNDEDRRVLIHAWIELGLISENGILTLLGEKLKPNRKWRDRFLYWTGPQLEAWVDSEKRLVHSEQRIDFFAQHADNVSINQLIHRVLDSYAVEDWSGISSILNFEKNVTVVDLGAGKGALLKAIGPSVTNRILVDRPEVIENLEIDGVELIACDIFCDELPKGNVYILSRVLHDWSDEICRNLLQRIPKSAQVVVIDRSAEPSRHGLLSLNMLLVNGGRERTAEDWNKLYRLSGWEIHKQVDWSGHSVMFLGCDC